MQILLIIIAYKSQLEVIYRHQKHAARIINFKDRFTHAQPLLHEMKAVNIFQTNFFSQNLSHNVQMQKEDSSSYFP